MGEWAWKPVSKLRTIRSLRNSADRASTDAHTPTAAEIEVCSKSERRGNASLTIAAVVIAASRVVPG
jgi:hypothetical protein